MPPQQALVIARERGLDLVEVSPTAQPPVCRITDYGRYQYQEQKRSRQAKKHQKTIDIKEIKFRPKVDEHDYQFKKKHIERILKEGDKVKVKVLAVDDRGKVRLSMKSVDQQTGAPIEDGAVQKDAT